MGWINKDEQKRVKKETGTDTEYMCDHCAKPIVGEVPVIDPKKGYHPWPVNTPDNMKGLTAREPKCTYHYQCDREIKGKTTPKKDSGSRSEKLRLAIESVWGMIKAKPRVGYWTKEKCVQKQKGNIDKRYVLKAIRELRKAKKLKKKEGGYVPAV